MITDAWAVCLDEQTQALDLKARIESEQRRRGESAQALPPLEAISEHCLACVDYLPNAVLDCGKVGCPLYPWRLGCQGHSALCAIPCRPDTSIPEGKHVAAMVQSAMKPTRTGGEILELVFEVVEGECAGRRLTRKLNLNKGGYRSRSNALSELRTICRNVGVLTPRDSRELHNLPLLIQVEHTVDRKGRARNRIGGYAALPAAGRGAAGKGTSTG